MKDKQGYIFIVLSSICFALGGLLIKINTWSPITINGMRGIFAFLMMIVYMKMISHRFVFGKTTLIATVAHFLMSACFVIANKTTTAANAIVLQYAMPVFLIILLWIFFKQKPDSLSLIACAVSIVGVVLVFMDSLSAGNIVGDCIALFTGLVYAIVMLSKKIPGSDFESSIMVSYMLSFLISIPFLMKEPSYPTGNFLSAAALGVAQIGLGYIFLSKGLDTVPPVSASLISMIEPVLNPILVAIFYKETIGFLGFIGAAIVIGSAAVYNVLAAKRS